MILPRRFLLLQLILVFLFPIKGVDSDGDDLLFDDDDPYNMDDYFEPQPRPTSSPTRHPSTNCFSGKVKVGVLDRGDIPLEQIQVGDRIQVMSDGPRSRESNYQQIYSFAHRDPEKVVEFIQVFTSNLSSPPLEVTPDHLVYILPKNYPQSSPTLIHAGSLQPGDTLWLQEANTPSRIQVSHLKRIYRPGVYAPLTKNGNFLANGVGVSTYVSLQKQTPSKFMLQNEIPSGLSHHYVAHMAMTPYRITCLAIGCSQKQNMPRYVQFLIQLEKAYHGMPLLAQGLLFGLFLIMGGMLLLAESVLGPMGVFVILTTIAPWVIYKMLCRKRYDDC